MSEGPRAWLTLVVVLAALVYPVVRGRDDYPLSTYPMFARPRPERELVDRALGVRRGDERVQLPLSVVGGDEPMQVVLTLGHAIYEHRTEPLCREIAERVKTHPELSDVQAVEIVTEEHDALAFFTQESPTPVGKVVRARCGVQR